ncbi:hypothetical protein [Ktedonospora formicarum]|uniref:Uncharacterized protein n=1 Tax=Ktedonospora formicarum TaxID=2778364 RepID=A0A8J3I678_9CHLR|nr:hypothetical protein [Ktedonospora formicarum]GHO48151.1 hypothetical protein KSX_63140 [Ktedonospora formicarum]
MGRTTEVIAISGRLPLGLPRSEPYYGDLFGARSTRDGISQLTTDLEGKPRLALIIACIWAKVRAGEQNEQLVEDAAGIALAIMEEERVELTRDSLLWVCQLFRQNFKVPGTKRGIQDKASDAHVATQILTAIVN